MNHITIVDATCLFVKKIHKIVQQGGKRKSHHCRRPRTTRKYRMGNSDTLVIHRLRSWKIMSCQRERSSA